MLTQVYTLFNAPLVRVVSWWQRRAGLWSSESVRQRRGYDLPIVPQSRPIWIHAASMGEVRVGALFAETLRTRGETVIASATSETGYTLARDLYPEGTSIFRCPFDLPGPVNRILSHFRPQAIVLVETEWWPHLLAGAQRAEVPVFVINGRLSARAFGRYRLARRYWSNILRAVEFFYMRSTDDAERVMALGVDRERVAVVGSLKNASVSDYESLSPALADRLNPDGAPVWIAGCTRPGEEEIVLAAYLKVQRDRPNLRLWIAPRHPERFDEVAALLERSAYPPVRLSQLLAGRDGVGENRVLLIDVMGHLAGLYSGADVAFVGGSMAPFGGHNPLEPASVGTPVIFGPHMDGQRDAARFLLHHNAAVEAHDADSLATTVADAIRTPVDQSERARRIHRLRSQLPDVRVTIADDLLSRLGRPPHSQTASSFTPIAEPVRTA